VPNTTESPPKDLFIPYSKTHLSPRKSSKSSRPSRSKSPRINHTSTTNSKKNSLKENNTLPDNTLLMTHPQKSSDKRSQKSSMSKQQLQHQSPSSLSSNSDFDFTKYPRKKSAPVKTNKTSPKNNNNNPFAVSDHGRSKKTEYGRVNPTPEEIWDLTEAEKQNCIIS